MSDRARQAAGPGAGPPGPADAGVSDDATLIRRSLDTPECFGSLFDRHAPAIHRYIAQRLGPDAADDLVSETFLVAFRKRRHYDVAHPDARPWLYASLPGLSAGASGPVTSTSTVVVIDTATNRALRTISVAPAGPGDIAIAPNGKTAYVPDAEAGTVIPINIATDTVLRPIKTAEDPTEIGFVR